jgi:glucose uptake protein GlcU
MDKKQFAFGKENYLLLAIAVVVILIGFFLVSGGKTTEAAFDPSIFNARRLLVAPIVIIGGFGLVIYAILKKSK